MSIILDVDRNGNMIMEGDLLETQSGQIIQVKFDAGQLRYYIADSDGYCINDNINNCNGIYLKECVKVRELI